MRKGKLRYALIVPTIVSVSIVMTMALVVSTSSRYSEAQRQMVDNSQSAIDAVLAAQKTVVAEDGGTRCPYAEHSMLPLFSEHSGYQVTFAPASQVAPDTFDGAALAAFRDRPQAAEYYEHDMGASTFRYSVPVRWGLSCESCHGDVPVGEAAGLYSVSSSTTAYDQSMVGYTLYDILFSLLLAVVCVIAIWIPLRRRVTDPIERFAQETSRITPDKLDTRLDAQDLGARGELADLVARFNEMVADLQESYDAVEAKVRQRTDELSRAMDELSAHRQEVEALNEQLLEESAYKSEFFATISHELKTPLSSMLANVRFLRLELGDLRNPRENETFDDIERNGQALLTLINQILDAARLEAGRMTFEETVVDMLDLINAAESTFRPIAVSKMIDYRTEVDDSFPLVLTDADKMDKIIRNLVGNALKFTPIGGTVVLSLGYNEAAGTMDITVSDDGIGFEGVDTERIFERFYQSDRSETRTYGGTGLGLSLVKEFAELGGGTVRAVSLEKGARFEVTVPARIEEEAEDGGEDSRR